MKIVLRVERASLRRWHLHLAERLGRREGVQVGFRLTAGAPPAPRAAHGLFQIEALLFGLKTGASQRLPAAALAGFADDRDPYLVIDLASAPETTGERTWRVECDGAGLEAGLLAALIGARSPIVRVFGASGPIAIARPGAENGGLVNSGFEEMLAPVATLIQAALNGAATAAPAATGPPAPF